MSQHGRLVSRTTGMNWAGRLRPLPSGGP